MFCGLTPGLDLATVEGLVLPLYERFEVTADSALQYVNTKQGMEYDMFLDVTIHHEETQISCMIYVSFQKTFNLHLSTCKPL